MLLQFWWRIYDGWTIKEKQAIELRNGCKHTSLRSSDLMQTAGLFPGKFSLASHGAAYLLWISNNQLEHFEIILIRRVYGMVFF